MAVSASKTFSAGESLSASDLNDEFTNIYSNGEDLGWPATKAKDFNGQELILDADADSSITSDTDDTIHFRLGGTDHFTMTTTGLTGTGINQDEIIRGAAANVAVRTLQHRIANEVGNLTLAGQVLGF